MSRSARYYYQLEAQRRRALYLARVRESTLQYHARLAATVTQCVRDGLDEYLPQEFERARTDLQEIVATAGTDPEAARDAAFRVGAYINQLPVLARDVARDVQVRAAEQRRQLQAMAQQAQSLIEAFLMEQTMAIKDPVVRDFAFDELQALRREWSERRAGYEDIPAQKQLIVTRMASIRSQAEAKAVEWKKRKEEQTRAEAAETELQMHREQVVKDLEDNPEALKTVLAQVDALRETLERGDRPAGDDVQQRIRAAVSLADEAVLDERCRQETLKAVKQSLESAGFVVGRLRRERDSQRDEVILMARKPSGQRAEFKVTLDGGLAYRFDQYEGKACRKDIDQVIPKLQAIYGIRLSNESGVVETPDRLSDTARPLGFETKEQHHEH